MVRIGLISLSAHVNAYAKHSDRHLHVGSFTAFPGGAQSALAGRKTPYGDRRLRAELEGVWNNNEIICLLDLLVLGSSACTTSYLVPPDPIPVIGAQLVGRNDECVDVQDGATVDGTPIVLVGCHGSPNERWLCLSETGGLSADQTPLILFNCNANPGQVWRIR